MSRKAIFLAASLLALASTQTGAQSTTLPATDSAAFHDKHLRPVVFVHGFFADGSSWSKVIEILQAAGVTVTSVQNPMASLQGDVDATKRVLEEQKEPAVLVGHSWAGAVITEAGDSDHVASLVYVAAFAPDQGQSVSDLTKPFPKPEWEQDVSVDAANEMRLNEHGFLKYFAPDVHEPLAKAMYAAQGTPVKSTLEQPLSVAAWHTKPSSWVLTTDDQIIAPALQQSMAARIHAKVKRIPSSHVAMVSHAREVAEVILEACRQP